MQALERGARALDGLRHDLGKSVIKVSATRGKEEGWRGKEVIDPVSRREKEGTLLTSCP